MRTESISVRVTAATVGAILVAMLLYRPKGILPERRNVSRQARMQG